MAPDICDVLLDSKLNAELVRNEERPEVGGGVRVS